MLVICFLTTSLLHGQVLKFRCSEVSIKNVNKGEQFSKSKKSNLLIAFDLDNQKVTFYTANIRRLDVAESGKKKDELWFNCLDGEGKEVSLRLITRYYTNDNGSYMELYYHNGHRIECWTLSLIQ